jgi:hypothetical protein
MTTTPAYIPTSQNNEYTYKKVLGVAYEYPGTSAATENISSLPYIFNTQLMTSQVPATAPTILTTPIETFTTGGTKYATTNSNIFYYENLGLSLNILNSYSYVYSTIQTENLTTQAIPSTYDPNTSSYTIQVYYDGTSIPYNNTTNGWIFDTATGCLTFIVQPFPGYPTDYPTISFYRYEGEFGVIVNDISGDLFISGSLDISGNLDVSGSSFLNGDVFMNYNLDVSGSSFFNGTLNVSGLVSQNLSSVIDISSTAFGYNCFTSYENYGGGSCTAFGSNCLTSSTGYGNDTCAFGYNCLSQNTGSLNCGFGYNSLHSNYSNNQNNNENSGFGSYTLYSNTNGYDNTAIGSNAMYTNQSGNHNTAVGYYSLYNNIDGSYNTAVGNYSLTNNTYGQYNTAIGHFSQLNTSNGIENTTIGGGSGASILNGSYNVCVGQNSDVSNASYSTALGYNTNCGVYSYSTAIGYDAVCTENHQIVLGTLQESVVIPGTLTFGTLIVNDLSVNNTLTVGETLNVNGVSTLTGNVGIGTTPFSSYALYVNGDAYVTSTLTINGLIIQNYGTGTYGYSTVFGLSSSTGGTNNTIFGYGNIYGNGGNSNAVFGDSCIYAGSYNTAIGHNVDASGGEGNTGIGNLANAYGSYNTAIGYYASCGNYNNSTAIGYSALCTESNQIMLGTPSQTVYAPGGINTSTITTSSDYRIKSNIQPLTDIFTIDELNPVSYYNELSKKNDVGLIAHELQEIYPDLVSGEKDGKEYQSVSYISLIPILIKELKDLKREVKELKNKLFIQNTLN